MGKGWREYQLTGVIPGRELAIHRYLVDKETAHKVYTFCGKTRISYDEGEQKIIFTDILRKSGGDSENETVQMELSFQEATKPHFDEFKKLVIWFDSKRKKTVD